jgi:adenine-specific DNA-methyltransferase
MVVDHILCFRKSDTLHKLREPRSEKQNLTYSNPDDDPRGVWTSVLFTSQRTKEERPNLSYPIENPQTKEIVEHPTNAWKYSRGQYERLQSEGRLYWGKEGGNKYPRIKRFLSELDDGVVPINLWYYKDTATLDEGTKLVDSILGKDVFDYPKPIQIVQRMLNLMNDSKAIILDFFSGSATTAHAVMQLNAEDSGHRKFIMVQLPEETDEKSEAYKAGYKNICEIGKERIRRAGRKIKEESLLTTQDLDIGFRVLKVDSTNMEDVYYNPAEIQQSNLFALADNIKPDRTPEDLLFQVMLDLGVLLSSKIEQTEIGGKAVYSVAGGYLLACFDKEVTDEVVTAIAKRKPYYFVMRDSSLAGDSVAANFEQIFAAYSPSTVRKVL